MRVKKILNIAKQELLCAILQSSIVATFILCFFSLTLPFFFFQPFFINGVGSTNLDYFYNTFSLVLCFFIPLIMLHAYKDIYVVFPISSTEIVLGKWFAYIQIILLLIIASIIVPFLVSRVGYIHLNSIIVFYITLICYSSAMSSIVLYISLWLRNIFASGLTLFLLFFLNTSHHINQIVNLPRGIRNIIEYVSFSTHLDAAKKGIVDTRDFLFFIFVTGAFLSVSALKISLTKRKTK